LSQSTPNGQHKRRLEIEKRQAEKARQQQVDDEAQRAEKLAKLKAIRKVEQIKFNGESVSILFTSSKSGLILILGIRCEYDIRTCWPWQISCVQKQNRSWYAPILRRARHVMTIYSTISHGNYGRKRRTASRHKSQRSKPS
jgi:hypothetical protein